MDAATLITVVAAWIERRFAAGMTTADIAALAADAVRTGRMTVAGRDEVEAQLYGDPEPPTCPICDGYHGSRCPIESPAWAEAEYDLEARMEAARGVVPFDVAMRESERITGSLVWGRTYSDTWGS